MAQFRIEIAGTVLEVSSLFESTRDYCRDYLTEKDADCFIEVCPEDLAAEQAALDEEAREEGLKRRKFSDPFLERTAIQRKTADHLLERNVLLIHGSAVAVDGRGYLFTAKCGTGKSTHVRFWRETFGERAVMINDDKPFLKLTEDCILVCGAPWSGKHGLHTNMTVPLQGICILNRGVDNRIRLITPEEALPMLLHQSNAPLDSSKRCFFEALVRSLSVRTPLWQMDCTKDPGAALVSHQAMK